MSFGITCDSVVLHLKLLLDLIAQLRPAGCRLILARFDFGIQAPQPLAQEVWMQRSNE